MQNQIKEEIPIGISSSLLVLELKVLQNMIKLYRAKYGYEEITGDEYIPRVSSLHNHNTQTHNLSVSEQTAVSTREQLKLRGITDCEQINERIDRDVFEQLKHKFDNTCQHD